MSETSIEKVKRLRDEYDEPNNVMSRMENLKRRLNTLCDTYGLECTSLASGLSEATISQYLKTKKPQSIGESAINKAEVILSRL